MDAYRFVSQALFMYQLLTVSYKHYSKGLDPVQTAFAVKQFKSHHKVGTPAEIKQLLAERELLLAQKTSRW